jgi:hypothetical protein
VILGAVCALVAALAVQKHMSRAKESRPAGETLQVLVALRDIKFGEHLVLDGHGENANVAFARGWPKNLVLAGAISEAARITDQHVRAHADFVTHEPILDSQIIAEDDFVPSGMVVEGIGIDANDIKSGRLRPGIKVDVLRVVDDNASDFMRSVKLYALGNLDPRGRPVLENDPPPTAWLMIRKKDQRAFLKAKVANHRFLVVEAANPDAPGPELVDEGAAAEARVAEAKSLLERARGLMDDKDYDRAQLNLQKIIADYSQLEGIRAEAEQQMAACRRKMAEALYEKARVAVEQRKDFSAALRWLDMVEEEFSDIEGVVARAKQLRETTQAELEKNRSQLRYQNLLTSAGTALQQGNLPQAEQALNELRQLVQTGLEGVEGTPAPSEVLAEYTARLNDIREKFEIDRKVLESHLKQQSYERAREKLQQMKEKYPAHPEMEELEKSVQPGEQAGP